jgi:hypothetical protein
MRRLGILRLPVPAEVDEDEAPRRAGEGHPARDAPEIDSGAQNPMEDEHPAGGRRAVGGDERVVNEEVGAERGGHVVFRFAGVSLSAERASIGS